MTSVRTFHLCRQGSPRPVVSVVPDPASSLYRVAWPDGTFSDVSNISRARDAARVWAEGESVRDRQKMAAARLLKSLDNFIWKSSPIAPNDPGATSGHPTRKKRTGGEGRNSSEVRS